METPLRGLAQRWQRSIPRCGGPGPALVLGLALATVTTLFFVNSDWGGDPESPRGDGRYRPVLARGDGHMTFLMTQSLVLDGDLLWDNNLARFGDPWNQPRTAIGAKMIPHPIGPSLVHAPFLAVAQVLAKVANALGADIPAHGYTMFHQRIVFATSPLFAWLAVLLACWVARRLLGGRWPSSYAAIAVLFATPVTYYATFMPSYAHAMDAAAGALFVYAWIKTWGQLQVRRFLLLGALIGLAALIRVTGFFWGAAVACELVSLLFQKTDAPVARRLARAALLGAIAFACAVTVFAPQLLVWKLTFGHWLVVPMGSDFVRLGHPQVSEALFSSRNGWFSTHPLAYSGMIGLLALPRAHRAVAVALMLSVAGMVWVNSAAGDWWGGAALGQRRLCGATAVLVLGNAALLHRSAKLGARLPTWSKHGLAILGLGWFALWNLAQVAQLTRGRTASDQQRSCCGYVPSPLRALATPIYRTIGNPFSFPANALFAARYQVDLRRWDEASGSYADPVTMSRRNPGRYQRSQFTWDVGADKTQPWILSGFSSSLSNTIGNNRFRWTTATRARALVPLWQPQTLHVTVPTVVNRQAAVEVSWNGTKVYQHVLEPGTHTIEFDISSNLVEVGNNVLAFYAPLSPHQSVLLPPPNAIPVGIAIGKVTFTPENSE